MTPTPEIHSAERLAAANRLLDTVCDPEIPVLTIADLGLLRAVRWNQTEQLLEVDITPTYSGCPAMDQIADDIAATLRNAGVRGRVVTQLAPAWTTDWMSEAAREKLRAYGIAPPRCASRRDGESVIQFAPRSRAAGAGQSGAAGQFDEDDAVPCPQCGSSRTTETSHFGSTACKALYRCLDCLEPFDYFKPL